MCGIVGLVGPAVSRLVPNLLEMRETIAHRGPDDAGVWRSSCGSALLGTRRLAILDLSQNGHQPMEDRPRGLAITFNGEIYNYEDLARDLVECGCRFRSRCDTEVLLKSYETWGERCLERLNGMFAFAIWDESRQELFAARDRFGEKPFYFYQDQGGQFLAFASEIKSLVAGRFFDPKPNCFAIYDFLLGGPVDCGPRTMFEKIHALPAAHALRFSWRRASLSIWRYWDLDGERAIRLADDREYARQFQELLSDSVRRRLRSDVPVGSSLSGGLDSSTIVGLLAKESPQEGQQTFSARFSDPSFDEGLHIQRMTSWTGVANYPVYPDPQGLPDEIEKLTWHQDAPFSSSSIYAQWCVMRLAKERGVTVLLDGQGGDELLAGYHSYFSAFLMRFLKRFRLLAAAGGLRTYVSAHGPSQLPLIFSALWPDGFRHAAKRWLRPRVIPVDFRRRSHTVPSAAKRKFRDPLHQALYESLTRSSLPQLLRYADRNSMAFSRELRLPFLDHQLVEYVFVIPPEQKMNAATTKVILRNATPGILPEEIRNRKDKLGFAPPESAWLRGPLAEFANDLFQSLGFRQREWVDAPAFARAWDRFRSGESALQGVIWRWLSLEVWARACLAPRPVATRADVATVQEQAIRSACAVTAAAPIQDP